VTRALGIKCSKDTLDWAVLEGADRQSALVVDTGRATAPAGSRGAHLVWVRRHIQDLLDRHTVDEVALRAVEPGGMGNSLPRAEVEGVVQEAVAAAGIDCRRVVAVSLRSAFAAKNGAELEKAAAAVPVVAATAKTRRDPVTAALVLLNQG
jgi:Holliday junction resolvasome RuvABC endonuclease subunit